MTDAVRRRRCLCQPRAARRLRSGAIGRGPRRQRGGGPSFGDDAQGRARRGTEAGRKSDAQTQAMATGKANVVDVVTAVAETEVAIEALVSVRDKVIAAYEEIMRMPI